jgi:DNA-binding NarL/FixJ family response regulator
MHSTAPIRVLIADDLPELRTLLRTTLQGRGLQLVGEAGDGHQTLALAVDTEPDVVVLDLGMPGADGPGLIVEAGVPANGRPFTVAMPRRALEDQR